jgi:UDP-N-acetylmuramoylalanine--D-glutamate ligase
VASALTALQSLTGPIILLAGGRDKGGSYAPLRGIMKERVKTLILMGEAKEKMRAAFEDLLPVHLVTGMEEGVRLAWAIAQGGEAILLSPACSSFDMFHDYEDRGRTFKEIVRQVSGGMG